MIAVRGESVKSFLRVLFRNFSFLGSSRSRYIFACLMMSVQILMAYINPYLYQQIIEAVGSDKGSNSYIIIALLFALLLLLTPIVCVGSYWQKVCAEKGIANLRKKVFSHIQRLPIATVMEYQIGNFITNISNDSKLAVSFFGGYTIIGLLKFVIYTVVSLVILIYIDWRLAALSIILAIVSVTISSIVNPKVQRLERGAKQSTSASASFLVETIRNMPIVRVFLLKDDLKEKYNIICNDIYKRRVHYRFLRGISFAFMYLFSSCAQPIGFVVGIALMINSGMDIATIVFASGVMGIMAEGVREVSSFIQFMQPCIVASQRIYEVLDAPIESLTKTKWTPCLLNQPVLSMKDIRFSYAGNAEILHGINLKIFEGEKLAIVGGSGGGKTTIFKLLQGFYSPDSGEICFCGCSIEKMSVADIRDMASYVSQDCTVFDDTIMENIKLGNAAATTEEVVDAAKKAYLHDFIMSLPEQYETRIGEHGSQISGGQRQRLAIARAILKDAPILLLDEATAALDQEAEKEVTQALESLINQKTTIVVAHKLKTIENADRIIVLEHGNVVEKGTHAELIQKHQRYYQLYQNDFI